MRKIIIILSFFIFSCKSTNNVIDYETLKKGYDIISIKYDFELTITDFYPCQSMPSCFGITHSLFIGKTSENKLPEKLTILSLSYNNKDFKIGEKIIIKPIEKPYSESDNVSPNYISDYEKIDGKKRLVIMGRENKATWGIPIKLANEKIFMNLQN